MGGPPGSGVLGAFSCSHPALGVQRVAPNLPSAQHRPNSICQGRPPPRCPHPLSLHHELPNLLCNTTTPPFARPLTPPLHHPKPPFHHHVPPNPLCSSMNPNPLCITTPPPLCITPNPLCITTTPPLHHHDPLQPLFSSFLGKTIPSTHWCVLEGNELFFSQKKDTGAAVDGFLPLAPSAPQLTPPLTGLDPGTKQADNSEHLLPWPRHRIRPHIPCVSSWMILGKPKFNPAFPAKSCSQCLHPQHP